MIKRVAALAGAYLTTVSSLAKSEAEQDMRRIEATVVRRAVGAVLALLGLAWLNVALLLFLLTTDDPIVFAAGIGVAVLVVGAMMLRGGAARTAPLARTREVLRGELASVGVGAGGDTDRAGTAAGARGDGRMAADVQAQDPLLAPPVLPLTPEGAAARLREIRIELGNEISPPAAPYVPEGVPPLPSRPDFIPRSRTMRTLLEVYRSGQSATGRRLLGGVLSLAALRSPKLRRAMAGAAMLRTVGQTVGTRLRRA